MNGMHIIYSQKTTIESSPEQEEKLICPKENKGEIYSVQVFAQSLLERVKTLLSPLNFCASSLPSVGLDIVISVQTFSSSPRQLWYVRTVVPSNSIRRVNESKDRCKQA